MSYGDSMNLRNILWLAPLPSNTSNDWLAPGMQTEYSLNAYNLMMQDNPRGFGMACENLQIK